MLDIIERVMVGLLEEINNCGTIMSMAELKCLAYGDYGKTEFVEDADGNVVEVNRIVTIEGLQEIADIYTDGFNCENY